MPPSMQPKPIRVGAWELQHHILKPTRCLLQTHAVRLLRALQQPHDFVTFVCSSHPPTPHPPPEDDDAASGRVTIHRILLEAAGTPLRALVSGPFKEAATNTITVHERFDSFEVVRKFLHCEPINMDHVPAELPLVADRWGLTTLFSACFAHAEERARAHSDTPRIHVAELVTRFVPVMAIVDIPSRFKTYLAMRIAVEMRLINTFFADNPVQIPPLCRDAVCSMHHSDGVQCRRKKSTILSSDSLPTTQVTNPSATSVPDIEPASQNETQFETHPPAEDSETSPSSCDTQPDTSNQHCQLKSDEQQKPSTESASDPSVDTKEPQLESSSVTPSDHQKQPLPNHSPPTESPPLEPPPQDNEQPQTDSVSQNGHLAQGSTINHNHSPTAEPESPTSFRQVPMDIDKRAEREAAAPVNPETLGDKNVPLGNSVRSEDHVSTDNDAQLQSPSEQKKVQDASVNVPEQETSEEATHMANHHASPAPAEPEQEAGQTTQHKPEHASQETIEKPEEQETTTTTTTTTEEAAPVTTEDDSEQSEGETQGVTSGQAPEPATADGAEEPGQTTTADESEQQTEQPEDTAEGSEQPADDEVGDTSQQPAVDDEGDTSEQPAEQPATDPGSTLPEASSTEVEADDDANQSESQTGAVDQTVGSSNADGDNVADGDTNADADSNADAVSDAADSTSPPGSIEADLPVYKVDPDEAKPQDWHKTFDIWNVFHQRSMLDQVIQFMSNYGSDNYIPLLLDVILNQLESTLSDDEILRFLRKCDWVWDAPALPVLCYIGKDWGPRAWRLLACAQTGYYGEGKEFQMSWNFIGLAGDIRARSLEVSQKPSDSESESSHSSTHDDAFMARWGQKVMDDEFEFTMELFIGEVGEPWEDLTPLYLKIRLLEKEDHPISSDAGKRKVTVRVNVIESGCGCVLGGNVPKMGSTASSSDGVLKRSTIDGFRNRGPNNHGYSYTVMDGRDLKDWLEKHSRYCGLALQVRLYVAPEDSGWSDTASTSSVETVRCTCGYCECDACDQQSEDDEQSEVHSENGHESGTDNDNDS